MKKERKIKIIFLIIVVLVVSLFLNSNFFKTTYFVYKEEDNLNELIEVARQYPQGDTYSIIDLDNSSKINDQNKPVYDILKDLKKEYGKYPLDFMTGIYLDQGDKMMIRITYRAEPTVSDVENPYDYRFNLCELLYMDKGYNLPKLYSKYNIHKIKDNWYYYNYCDYVG